MKKILLQFFAQLQSKSKPSAEPTALAPAVEHSPATVQDSSESDTRRQLVYVLLSDLLYKHGLPSHWIDCQMLMVSSRSKGSGMFLRLVVRHWDDRLLNYAPALQRELLAEIKQFEPQAANWLRGISWQLEVDDSCPYTVLPGKEFWQPTESRAKIKPTPTPTPTPTPAEPTTPAVPVLTPYASAAQSTERSGSSAAAQELDRVFAVRDKEIKSQTDNNLFVAGYEKTQPAPL